MIEFEYEDAIYSVNPSKVTLVRKYDSSSYGNKTYVTSVSIMNQSDISFTFKREKKRNELYTLICNAVDKLNGEVKQNNNTANCG